jgi:hypothetical protein
MRKTPSARLREEILKEIEQGGGTMVYRDLWHVAEDLLSRKLIASLGPPLGPGNRWRRAEPKR